MADVHGICIIRRLDVAESLEDDLMTLKEFIEKYGDIDICSLFTEEAVTQIRPVTVPAKERKLMPGGTIEWEGLKWIVLDPDYHEEGENEKGIFVIAADPFNDFGDDQAFDDKRNNYETSEIRGSLVDYLNDNDFDIDALITHKVDLTADNGDDLYGFVRDKLFLISCDEYRKYRIYIPKYDGYWWTCTPWSCGRSADYARNVTPSGTIGNNGAGNGYGCVPACIIKESAYRHASGTAGSGEAE